MLLEFLSNKLLLETDYISNLAFTASVRYKKYLIKKKNGGVRLICHPSKELKALQSVLHEDILSKLPIHDCAFAYRKKINLSLHAQQHVKAKYLLRMDFKKFFESIKFADIKQFINDHKEYLSSNWVDSDTNLLCQIVCYNRSLTIGSVTSPVLSNSICYELDVLLENICHSKNVTYTRYADDLYFSTDTPNILRTIQKEVTEQIKCLKYPSKLKINSQKTHHCSRKNRINVTGLVISNDGKVSIGRDKKRKVRTMIFTWDQLNSVDKSYLAGFLSYCISVEPEFINSLCTKYGSDLIVKIKKYQE